ncbi:putative protein phosphatase 2C 62 [Bienertia sinuspersici]
MADLLYNNLLNSFNFSTLSLPLNFSHHPNFFFIRLAPLKLRFSHSPLLASHSSQFHIVSRTEHEDGSVIFKFGDSSEVFQIVDDLDGGNVEDLERDDMDGNIAEQANVVKDDDSDSIELHEDLVKNNFVLSELNEDSVDGEPKAVYSTLTAKEENSSDSVEDELKGDSNVTAVVDSLNDSNVTVELENSNHLVKDELKSYPNSALQVEYLSASVEDEVQNDSNSAVEVKSDSHSTEVKDLSSSIDDELKTVKSDSASTAEVVDSIDFDKVKNEYKGVNNAASTCDSSVEVVIDKGDELTAVSEEMSSNDKLESGGDESTIMSDTSSNVEAVALEVGEIVDNTVEEDNATVELMPKQLEAEQIPNEEDDDKVKLISEQLKAEPVLNKENKNTIEMISEQLEAEPIHGEEDEDTVGFMSKLCEGQPLLDEESSSNSPDDVVTLGSKKVALAGHPSIAKLDDEPLSHDVSDAAPPDAEASGITSKETDSDSG